MALPLYLLSITHWWLLGKGTMGIGLRQNGAWLYLCAVGGDDLALGGYNE